MPEYWVVEEVEQGGEVLFRKLATASDEEKGTTVFDAMREAGLQRIKLVKVVLEG